MREFSKELKIGNKLVGDNNPVLIIAEAGVAHFGDIELAYDLVNMAAEAEADVFKIQVFDVDALISSSGDEWKDRLRKRNLTLEQVLNLKELVNSLGMEFLVTAHDETRINWITELDMPAIKIGSGEKNNISFIKKLAALQKPMIISTGMHSLNDIKETLSVCADADNIDIALLHCVTSYPTPIEQVNLNAIDAIKSVFSGPVGYSDHTIDDLAVLAAVSKGARVIERHITILKDIPNAQDWKVSSNPEEFKKLVKDIRTIETLLGSREKELQSCELNAEKWAIKSLVAKKDLLKGSILWEEDVLAKRCANGVKPNNIKSILGKKLKRDIKSDQAITMNDIEI